MFSRIGSLLSHGRKGKGLLGPSLFAFAIKGVGAASQFAFTLLAARLLGVDGSGAFFLALTVATLATVLGRQGLDSTITRFVAAAIEAGRLGEVRGVMAQATRLVALVSLPVTLLLLAGSGFLAASVFGKPELTRVLAIMSLSVLPYALSLVQAEALKGLGWVQSGVAIQSVLPWLVSTVLMLPLVRLWGVPGAAAGFVGGLSVTATIGVLLWHRATRQWRHAPAAFDGRVLLRASIPLLWVASINVLMNWSGTLFLGVWGTKADVGIFNAAYRTAMLISLVLLAVNSVVGRLFAAAYQRGDREAIRRLMHRSTKLMTWSSLPFTLALVLAPGWVMGVFGNDFVGGGLPLAILAVAQFFNVAAGSLGKLLIMTGHERVVRNAVAITGVVSIVATLVLVPMFGVLGAAIAAAVAIVLRNVLCGVAVYQVFRIAPLWV